MRTMQFPDDLKALAGAIRPQMVAGTPSSAIDYRLSSVAARHGVSGLLAAAVGDKGGVQAAIARSLVQLSAAARLNAAFSDLPHLFLKGLALGQLAYDQPLLKQASDIDLLVLSNDLDESAERLHRLDYARVVPTTRVDLNDWHRISNQSVWINSSGQVLELHDNCVSIPGMLTHLRADSLPRRLPIAGGVTLPTYDDASNFTYLAVHGATSAWFRLKWVADFAGFCLRRPDRIQIWFDAIDDHRVRSAAACALMVADSLFSLPLGQNLRTQISSDRLATAMAEVAGGMLVRGEPTARIFGTLPIHRSAISLAGVARVPRMAANLIQRRLLVR